jgi:hypothetical protein
MKTPDAYPARVEMVRRIKIFAINNFTQWHCEHDTLDFFTDDIIITALMKMSINEYIVTERMMAATNAILKAEYGIPKRKPE